MRIAINRGSRIPDELLKVARQADFAALVEDAVRDTPYDTVLQYGRVSSASHIVINIIVCLLRNVRYGSRSNSSHNVSAVWCLAGQCAQHMLAVIGSMNKRHRVYDLSIAVPVLDYQILL